MITRIRNDYTDYRSIEIKELFIQKASYSEDILIGNMRVDHGGLEELVCR
jgi:hypothetical protein